MGVQYSQAKFLAFNYNWSLDRGIALRGETDHGTKELWKVARVNEVYERNGAEKPYPNHKPPVKVSRKLEALKPPKQPDSTLNLTQP